MVTKLESCRKKSRTDDLALKFNADLILTGIGPGKVSEKLNLVKSLGQTAPLEEIPVIAVSSLCSDYAINAYQDAALLGSVAVPVRINILLKTVNLIPAGERFDRTAFSLKF